MTTFNLQTIFGIALSIALLRAAGSTPPLQAASDTTTLADDKDHVNIAVSGPGIEGNLTAKVTKFGAPYYLDNLQNGTYTVKLDLVDKNDKPIPGSWNSVTRDIKIDHEAQADAMPGMPGMSNPSSAPATPPKK